METNYNVNNNGNPGDNGNMPAAFGTWQKAWCILSIISCVLLIALFAYIAVSLDEYSNLKYALRHLGYSGSIMPYIMAAVASAISLLCWVNLISNRSKTAYILIYIIEAIVVGLLVVIGESLILSIVSYGIDMLVHWLTFKNYQHCLK